jgi:hypothetical protein
MTVWWKEPEGRRWGKQKVTGVYVNYYRSTFYIYVRK